MVVTLVVNFGLALGVSFLAGSAQTLVWTDFSLTGTEPHWVLPFRFSSSGVSVSLVGFHPSPQSPGIPPLGDADLGYIQGELRDGYVP